MSSSSMTAWRIQPASIGLPTYQQNPVHQPQYHPRPNKYTHTHTCASSLLIQASQHISKQLCAAHRITGPATRPCAAAPPPYPHPLARASAPFAAAASAAALTLLAGVAAAAAAAAAAAGFGIVWGQCSHHPLLPQLPFLCHCCYPHCSPCEISL